MNESHRIRAVVLLVTISLVLGLSACTAGGGGRLEGMPTPPAEAAPVPDDQLPFNREAIVEGFRDTMGVGEVEIAVYQLPVEIPYAEIVAHYQDQLTAAWVENEPEGLQAARAQGRDGSLWVNEETGELLSLQYLAPPGFGGNILMVLYAQ